MILSRSFHAIHVDPDFSKLNPQYSSTLNFSKVFFTKLHENPVLSTISLMAIGWLISSSLLKKSNIFSSPVLGVESGGLV